MAARCSVSVDTEQLAKMISEQVRAEMEVLKTELIDEMGSIKDRMGSIEDRMGSTEDEIRKMSVRILYGQALCKVLGQSSHNRSRWTPHDTLTS